MRRVVGWVARLLAPDQRAVALGDFEELGVAGWRALGEIAGLVIRQQLHLWMTWRPWFALIGLAGAAGAFLGRVLFGLNVVLDTNITAYAHYQVLMNDATVSEVILRLISMFLIMFACSWTIAYLLGRVSRRALWITIPMFYLMVLDSFPAWLFYMSYMRGSRNPLLILAMNLLPLNPPGILAFLLPALLGLRRGLRRASA